MILLFVGLALTALMAYIIRQLHFYLSPERFRQIVVPLIPTYLLINWVFTLFTRTPGEYPIVLVPLHAYIQILGWDIRSFDLLCHHALFALRKIRPIRFISHFHSSSFSNQSINGCFSVLLLLSKMPRKHAASTNPLPAICRPAGIAKSFFSLQRCTIVRG